MPQIKVNEIDQSVVTRVVSDDKVKILVPIIASFGPTLQDSDDGEPIPVNTFTDITDFNRMYGYTPVEFNPFSEEYSRNYAAQLIQKGGAVSVVRVNKGDTASFKLAPDGADRTNPSASTVCPATEKNPEDYYDDVSLNDKTTFLTDLGYTNIVPETVSITFTVSDGTAYTGSDVPVVVEGSPITTGTIALKYMDGATEKTYTGTITYASGAVAWSGNAPTLKANTNVLYDFKIKNFVEGTFCPQIASIKAKYDGSFGNDLLIGITQLTTANVSQSYQYANVSVYRVVKNIVKKADGTYDTVISGISVLETQRVTTDPDSPYYFEDVDFEFITIKGTDSAREELRVIWSNISANPEDDVLKYSGFPTVRVRYNTNTGMVYNTNALLSGGSDFAGYSQELLEKLRKGFKGYYTGDTWSLSDVYAYQKETYGSNTAVVPSVYNAIADIYKNFTDPYVYDFDFVTSGGFVYTKYSTVVNVEASDTETTDTLTAPEEGHPFKLSKTSVAPGTLHFTDSGSTTYKDSVSDDPYIGNISANGSDTVVAYINYSTGELTNASGQSVIAADVEVSYRVIKSVKPQLIEIPLYFDSTKTKSSYYEEITPIHAEMKNLVESRQDCIALFDVPYDYDTSLIVSYSGMLNTSYGTMHHPWCWVQHPTIANKQIRMSPSYIFLYTFLSNLIDNVDSQKWFPPAGVKRATARVVKRPDYEIGSVILNMWQNDNISRVNPIMKLKQYGYVIYGQYTTLQAIDLYTHSALESLNVRLISNVVKKKIFDVCLNLAFEPNTSTLWLKFYAQMDEFLRYMKYNDGVYDYKIKMDESTVTTDDINHLKCPGKVWIAPTRTAEFFDIDFIITEAGALFPED